MCTPIHNDEPMDLEEFQYEIFAYMIKKYKYGPSIPFVFLFRRKRLQTKFYG
jgi:hypothetical protein